MIITREFVDALERKASDFGDAVHYDAYDILAVVEHIRKQEAEINRLRAELATLKADAAPVTEAPAVASEPTIEVGDKVVVVAGEDAGRTGVVVFTPQRSHPVYTVLKGMVYIAYRREEIEKL